MSEMLIHIGMYWLSSNRNSSYRYFLTIADMPFLTNFMVVACKNHLEFCYFGPGKPGKNGKFISKGLVDNHEGAHTSSNLRVPFPVLFVTDANPVRLFITSLWDAFLLLPTFWHSRGPFQFPFCTDSYLQYLSGTLETFQGTLSSMF